MTDLDFERKVNPWLFDSSGNLTEAAKKQFPDLAAAAAGAVAPGWAPPPVATATPGGPSVSVSPDALRKAGTNAGTLHTDFDKATKDVWKDLQNSLQGMSKDWAIVGAVQAAHELWQAQAQAQATSQTLADISTGLTGNADQYARAEQTIAQNMKTN
ncbi:WXG100 family type VII secretion target [Kitasatospora sp. NPDC094011]|uniref:WXG100 family type VII secretion target n=1 Tax=Kitasatospora sp. NPDC094011 TaxID=3364090 RepID=UPI0038111AA8